MSDDKTEIVSADEARGYLVVLNDESRVPGLIALRLARTVIALHARAEQAERERDAARVFLDAEIGANVRWAAQAERDLLRRLWQRIDGEQDGDAPSAAEMEDGLVRLFDEMRADVERCAADENASTQEAERLRERNRQLSAECKRLQLLREELRSEITRLECGGTDG